MPASWTSLYFIFVLLLIASISVSCHTANGNSHAKVSALAGTHLADSLIVPKSYWADSFDFPVGDADAKGYYNAQAFGENDHLGDDWNATTGGNTDLGDPINVVANGQVSFAKDIGGGWGNVIRVIHFLPDSSTYESIYAHCDSVWVYEEQWVKKGQQIGTIGDANGIYLAHLHLEIRDSIHMPIGGGYGSETKGYLDPTAFIRARRKIKNAKR